MILSVIQLVALSVCSHQSHREPVSDVLGLAITMAGASLGDGNFSALLWSYKTTVTHVLHHCLNK